MANLISIDYGNVISGGSSEPTITYANLVPNTITENHNKALICCSRVNGALSLKYNGVSLTPKVSNGATSNALSIFEVDEVKVGDTITEKDFSTGFMVYIDY